MNNNLKTKYLGKEIFEFKEIDSTQKELWRRIENGNASNGCLIIAEKQTAGIGTHGRKWYADSENITFSFSIFPNCNISKLENLTYRIAEILKEVFKEFEGSKIYILDAASEDELVKEVFTKIKEENGKIDGIVHAIAHANTEDLHNDFIYTGKEGFAHANDIT